MIWRLSVNSNYGESDSRILVNSGHLVRPPGERICWRRKSALKAGKDWVYSLQALAYVFMSQYEHGITSL